MPLVKLSWTGKALMEAADPGEAEAGEDGRPKNNR